MRKKGIYSRREHIRRVGLREYLVMGLRWKIANTLNRLPGQCWSSLFTSGRIGSALSYPCDTFLTWQDNLRAIALALTALRTVDRYGAAHGLDADRHDEATNVRRARRLTHPDHAGDRRLWDNVEQAARVLGLQS